MRKDCGYIRILPHTADIRMKIKGKDQVSLFLNCLKGLNIVLTGEEVRQKGIGHFSSTITIHSPQMDSLLIDFLSEVLTKSYENKAIFNRVKFLSITGNMLKAVIAGYKVSGFLKDVKAVTYCEVSITKDKENNFTTNLVLDI